jgi:hypothetical protein
MYLVKSIRSFFGTNAERMATALNLFLPGDEFIETDTSDKYIHNGMAWVETSGAGIPDVDDLTTATGSSGEMVRVAAAGGLEYRTTAEILDDIGAAASGHSHSAAGSDGQLLYNNGGAFDGANVYWDDINSRLGVGESAPQRKLHVTDNGSIPAIFENQAAGAQANNAFYHSDTTDGNIAILAFQTDTTGAGAITQAALAQIRGVFVTHDHATQTANITFNTRQSGSGLVTRLTIAAGVVVGSPTGGDKGVGTINATAVYDDNTLLTDFVFEDDYQLLPIDSMTVFYQTHKHLPTIPGRKVWESEGKFSLGKLANHLWETVEVQAIYINQLNERLKVLENGK